MRSVARLAERLGDRLRGFAQPWELACFVWVPALVLGFTAWAALRGRKTLGDFPIFRVASKAVLHGHSPYVAADAHALANFDKFVYPPAAAFLFSPLAVVPYSPARVLILALGVVSVLGALRLLEVRDWRCYGLAAVSAPVVNSVALGAFTAFLLLGTAAVWRLRDRPAASGLVAAATATAKLFLWPLGLWLLVTRRLRAAAVFTAATVVLVLGGWAAIGFAGFHAYPHLLRVLSQLEAASSYSVVALLHVTGTAATVVSVALSLGVAAAVALAARGADGTRRAFSMAVIGALVATPVVWLHYDALLFVPIALYRPRLTRLWLVPVALWATPATHSDGSTWRIALSLAAVATVAAVVLRGTRQEAAPARQPGRKTAAMPSASA